MRPQGNCLFCGYPMNPGVCPECGRLTDADNIHVYITQSPSRRLFKRINYKHLSICISCVIIGIAYNLLSRVNWLKLKSNSQLVLIQKSIQESQDYPMWIPSAVHELYLRYQNGSLDTSETKQMFEQALLQSAKLVNESSPGFVTVRYQLKLLLPDDLLNRGRLYWYEYKVKVDDVVMSEHRLIQFAYGKLEFEDSIRIQETSRVHNVTVDGVLRFESPHDMVVGRSPPLHTWVISRKFVVAAQHAKSGQMPLPN